MASLRRHRGKFAQIYYSGVLIAEMNDATLSIDPKFAESQGWGKNWTVRDPVGGDWKISATKYNNTANLAQFIALAAMSAEMASPATAIVYSSQGGAKLLEGPVWPGPATMSLPEGEHSKETLDFVAADAPTYVGSFVPTA